MTGPTQAPFMLLKTNENRRRNETAPAWIGQQPRRLSPGLSDRDRVLDVNLPVVQWWSIISRQGVVALGILEACHSLDALACALRWCRWQEGLLLGLYARQE